MFLGEANIDGVASLLFSVDDKITGYKISDWRRYPLDNKEFDELKKLQLSSNNKVIEDNDYKVILDLDSGYKHYFKDGKEDLMMFYQMNGEDYTLYLGKSKNSLRRKIGKIIYLTFAGFVLVYNSLVLIMSNLDDSDREKQILSSSIEIVSCYAKSLNFENDKEVELSIHEKEILPMSARELSYYIETSTNLNNEEKAFLDNEIFFNDMLPYINKSDYLSDVLRYTLKNVGIAPEELGGDWTGLAGYNNNTRFIHVIGYNEKLFPLYKHTVAHEFCHYFDSAIYNDDFNYIFEAVNEILTYEYYNVPHTSYIGEVKIVKCLMEIVGPEPVLEYHLCGDASYLYDSLSPYLTEEDLALFSIDKGITDYTYEERITRYIELRNVLEKLYYAKYGESMWTNEMISAIFKEYDYQRYYFNSKKIENTEMYASMADHVEEMTLEEAVNKRLVYPYKERIEKVSLEEWLEYDGPKDIKYDCSFPNCRIYKDNYLEVFKEDNTIMITSIEEAYKKGYLNILDLSVTRKEQTTDLTNPDTKYDHEDNCWVYGDTVLVTIYKKVYFPPIQEKGNMLN